MTSSMGGTNIPVDIEFTKKYKKFGDICLTKDNTSVFVCAACQEDFGTVQAFWLHIQKYHNFENQNSINQIKINCFSQNELFVNESKMTDIHDGTFDIRRAYGFNTYPEAPGSFQPAPVLNVNNPLSCYMLQNQKINGDADIKLEPLVQSGQVPVLNQKINENMDIKIEPSTKTVTNSDAIVKTTKTTCFECGIKFTTNTQLYRHNGYHHRRAKVCTICDSAFSSESSLQIHMRLHDDTRKFVCPTCGKKFNRNTSLRNHMLVHDDVRPFSCAECQQTFKLKLYLSRHRKRVHKIFK